MKNYKKTIKQTISIIAATCALFIFNSCKKEDNHDDHDTDKTAPMIAVTAPTAMQIYNSGDTVWIKGTVTDANLHELVINIRKDSDSSIYFTSSPTMHDLTTYQINTFWKSAVTGHTNATLEILAEDHAGNIGKSTTAIHIMP